DLPRVTVRIDEDAGVAAPEGRRALARDPGARGACLRENGVDLLGRADIVGQRHAAPAPAVVHSGVLSESVTAPEGNDRPAGLEENDVLGIRSDLPAEALVKRARTGQIGDTDRDRREALLHAAMIAETPSLPSSHGS